MKPNILAIRSARGGSKGIFKKNIRLLVVKSLNNWTIGGAAESQLCKRLIVSIDHPEIASKFHKFVIDIPFIMPSAISSDTATSLSIVVQ